MQGPAVPLVPMSRFAELGVDSFMDKVRFLGSGSSKDSNVGSTHVAPPGTAPSSDRARRQGVKPGKVVDVAAFLELLGAEVGARCGRRAVHLGTAHPTYAVTALLFVPSGARLWRMGARAVLSIEAVCAWFAHVVQMPGKSDPVVVQAWKKCAVTLRALKIPLGVVSEPAKEVLLIHPVVRAAVDAILTPGSGCPRAQIKCFGDVVAADSIPFDQIKPDLVFTALADAQPSLRASVVFMENKLVGNVPHAVSQCIAYLRRLLRELIEEWHSRFRPDGVDSLQSEGSMRALADLFAVGAGCDGASLQLVYVKSGVTKKCRGLKAVKEVLPVVASTELPFLPIFRHYAGGPIELGEVPSDGFRAMFCLLRLAPNRLTPASLPLTSITTTRETTYKLVERLGRGGIADVYRGTMKTGRKQTGVVVKVPCSTTRTVRALFEAEYDCLHELGGVDELFPAVLEYTDVKPTEGSVTVALPTPMLVFSRPVHATPLLLHMRSVRTEEALVMLADHVVNQLLKTVKVRSSNSLFLREVLLARAVVVPLISPGSLLSTHSRGSRHASARSRQVESAPCAPVCILFRGGAKVCCVLCLFARRLLMTIPGFMATSGQRISWSKTTGAPWSWCAGASLACFVLFRCALRNACVCGACRTQWPVEPAINAPRLRLLKRCIFVSLGW
jgi:hypothetical protein